MSILNTQKIQVVEMYAKGLGYKTISKRLEISISYIRTIVKNWKNKGNFDRKSGSGTPKS